MSKQSEVVVQFVGETGAGEGVTNDFYNAVARELQKIRVNTEIPMWCDPSNRHISASFFEEEQDKKELMRPFGLFPRPLFHVEEGKKEEEERKKSEGVIKNEMVLKRFRLLGRLMGQVRRKKERKKERKNNFFFVQVFLDDKNLPLPLAKEFFDLLKGIEVSKKERKKERKNNNHRMMMMIC